ncbi:hypothetical protein DFS34DRAFT_147739 [Phlyctochytrium arcticum]|nr:hypothetical protein DFS34DRAFT_147739 [Phlyctochytrium arcticum]
MKVNGKVAIITGASSGFGKALAARLVDQGAKVVLGDINEATGQAVTKELNAKKQGSAVFTVCDVTKKEHQQKLFDLAKSSFGTFDIVVNNAGIGEGKSFTEDTEDRWISVLRIDLEAVIIGTRLALTEFIKEKRPGVIINTASLAGLYPQPWQPVYAAAKGGVVHFTRSCERFGKSHNIRVNAIAPSFSPTGIIDEGVKNFGEGFKKITANMVPVDVVIDAFMQGIEDEGLAGAILRVTPEHGIDQYSWRRTKNVTNKL